MSSSRLPMPAAAVDRITGPAAAAMTTADVVAAAVGVAAAADYSAAVGCYCCCFDENSVAFGADRVDTNLLDPCHGILLLRPKAAADNAAESLVNRPSSTIRKDLNLRLLLNRNGLPPAHEHAPVIKRDERL